MAPQAPKKRTTARARATKAAHSAPKASSNKDERDEFSSFKASKEDKRRLKHSKLISRIEKTRPGQQKKKRRPSKKLVATLESLADALPSADGEGNEDAVVGGARIRHASLKSRPGAMKRKEKLESMERDRFSKNMAQMAALPVSEMNIDGKAAEGSEPKTHDISSRWAALRGFIQSTLDK